jgi:uncharacterized OB-fold protein
VTLPAIDIPRPDDPVSSAAHWGWLQKHELRVQRCTACGTTRNPPAEVCHACYATDTEWIELEPIGRIYSWTRVWHAARDELVGHSPYVVVWVEIDHPDRPRFLGNLRGDPLQNVVIGDSVVGVFEDRPGGTLLNWSREVTP